MRRDLNRLSSATYDVLIVGGGIYGAWAAWEAALRGLSVALIEQHDFGHATSSNSQKIIHGGFRYLQSLDVKRMRESIRERRALLRVAPHLVQVLPCVMPTYRRSLLRGRPAMAAALAINDLIAWDRNAGLADAERRIPRGRMISADECLRLAPGVPSEGLTGGALWYDAQLHDSERLILAVVRSAAAAGAEAANYLRVTGFLREGRRVVGVKAADRFTPPPLPEAPPVKVGGFTQDVVEVRARVVLNTAGPWMERLLDDLNGRLPPSRTRWLKAVNLVLGVPMPQGTALALPTRTPNPHVPGLLFVTPWNDRTIVGGTSVPYEDDPDTCRVTEPEIEAFLRVINAAYPAWHLARRHVERLHIGLVPAATHGRDGQIQRHYEIRDYRRSHGIDGLMSVLGVKYTTARDVAVKAVDAVFKKLGRVAPRSRSHATPVYGGSIPSLRRFIDGALKERPWGLNAAAIHHLIRSYGSAYPEVVRLIRENLIWAEPVAPGLPAIKAEVIHAIRHEMAQTLGDVVFRRTGLGAGGFPGAQALEACADVMAAELEWAEARRQRELDDVRSTFVRLGWQPEAAPAATASPALESVEV